MTGVLTFAFFKALLSSARSIPLPVLFSVLVAVSGTVSVFSDGRSAVPVEFSPITGLLSL
jgi:hypothetical protein